MKTLADAWSWYSATRENLARMRRLGEKHWNDPNLANTSIRQDDRFRMLEAETIVAETNSSLMPIDDLAVVVMFSVFESRVREYLIDLMWPEAKGIIDSILKEAAEDAIGGVKEGSFSRCVLEPLKNQKRVSDALVEQINQIRKYRNWVAHGRRDSPENNVTPAQAYTRLEEFLGALGITAEAEEDNPNRPD
jgi:hypothetical protein